MTDRPADAPSRVVNSDRYAEAYASSLELYQRLNERHPNWVNEFNRRHGIRVA